jgi:hypothetical protein
VVPDTARRVVSSLQWYSDNLEHPIKKFVVESDAVKAALKAQKLTVSQSKQRKLGILMENFQQM